ncbi:MAG: DUF2163 domain-containing protein [Fimbriimonas sp.]
MPRPFPAPLLARLASGSCHLALLVLILPAIRPPIGFTTWDADVAYAGQDYLATDGPDPSGITQTLGTGVSNLDLSGVLRDSRLTAVDFAAGVYDACTVEVRLCDPTDMDAGVALIFVGDGGNLTQRGPAYTMEVRSILARLKREAGWTTSGKCICRRLGDHMCQKDLAGTCFDGVAQRSIRATRTVAAVDGREIEVGSDSAPTGFYGFGIAKMTSGPNAGWERDIELSTLVSGGQNILLREAFPFPVTTGETILLEAGCDRLIPTCAVKYDNNANCRCQPYMPGNENVQKQLEEARAK